MKKLRLAATVLLGGLALAGCSSQADTASSNISKDADSFKIERDMVFYNARTGTYIAEVKGLCSIGNDDSAGNLTYTCKVGQDKFIKNFLGLSRDVTWFALQTKPSVTDPFHYEVVFRPETIIPDVNMQTSGGSK